MSDTMDQVNALRTAARAALDRAHAAALAATGGELRRALEQAQEALRAALALAPPEPTSTLLHGLTATLDIALADLDTGALAALEPLIEAARKDLGAA